MHILPTSVPVLESQNPRMVWLEGTIKITQFQSSAMGRDATHWTELLHLEKQLKGCYNLHRGCCEASWFFSLVFNWERLQSYSSFSRLGD